MTPKPKLTIRPVPPPPLFRFVCPACGIGHLRGSPTRADEPVALIDPCCGVCGEAAAALALDLPRDVTGMTEWGREASDDVRHFQEELPLSLEKNGPDARLTALCEYALADAHLRCGQIGRLGSINDPD